MEEEHYSQEEDYHHYEKKKKKKKKSKKNLEADETEIDSQAEGTQLEELTEAEELSSPKKKKKKKSKEYRQEEEEVEEVPVASTSKAALKESKSQKAQQEATQNETAEWFPPLKKKAVNKKTSNSDAAPSKSVPPPPPVSKSKTTPKTTPAQKAVSLDDNLFNGMQILAQMSNDDIEELLNRIQPQCPISDIKREKARENLIDWKEVAFSCYGPAQCKSAWMYLRSQSRTYRILHEVVDEVKYNFKADYQKFMKKIIESSPDFPKQPYGSSGFHIYCKELWDKYKDMQVKMNAKVVNFLQFQTKCYQDWRELSKERREEFESRAAKDRAEHAKKVKEFYAKFPGFAPRQYKLDKDGKPEKQKMTKVYKQQALKISTELHKDAPPLPMTPLQLFVNSKLNRLDPPPTADEISDLKTHYVEKWKKLSDGKRLKWIENCIKKSERYLTDVREYKRTHPLYLLPTEFKISKLITKVEFSLWASAHGQPERPHMSAYDLFLEEFRTTEEALDIGSDTDLREQAQAKWNALDRYHRRMYELKHAMQKETYKKDVEEYYQNLPHLLRAVAVDTLPKYIRKNYIEDAVAKNPLVLLDEEPVRQGTATNGSTDDDTNGKRKRDNSVNEETSQDEDGSPKKKKKKKRKKEDDTEEQPEEPPAKSIPLYLVELTEEHKKLIDEKLKEEKKALKGARKNKTVDKEPSPVNSSYQPGKLIVQSMIIEAIRGIFDGSQFERKFSAYYYYGKYVIQEKSWQSMCRQGGIIQCAIRVIESFNRLSEDQQRIFLDEAISFHKVQQKFGSVYKEQDLLAPSRLRYFPDEPKPPPRFAEDLYEKECKVRKGNEYVPPWHSLDENTHMLYMKKLYKMHKDYIIQYDKFVKHMTPNDMVEYLVSRCHQWEIKRREAPFLSIIGTMQTATKPTLANDTFRAELSPDGPETEPELYNMNGVLADIAATIPRTKYEARVKFAANPFATTNKNLEALREETRNKKRLKHRELECLRKKLEEKRRLQPSEDIDSDLPSSSDEDSEENLLVSHDIEWKKKKAFRKKIRDLKRYYYPLEDLYEFHALNAPKLPRNWDMSGEGMKSAGQTMEYYRQRVEKQKSLFFPEKKTRRGKSNVGQKAAGKNIKSTRVNDKTGKAISVNKLQKKYIQKQNILKSKVLLKSQQTKSKKLVISAQKRQQRRIERNLMNEVLKLAKEAQYSTPNVYSLDAPVFSPSETLEPQKELTPTPSPGVPEMPLSDKGHNMPSLMLVTSSPPHQPESSSSSEEVAKLSHSEEEDTSVSGTSESQTENITKTEVIDISEDGGEAVGFATVESADPYPDYYSQELFTESDLVEIGDPFVAKFEDNQFLI